MTIYDIFMLLLQATSSINKTAPSTEPTTIFHSTPNIITNNSLTDLQATTMNMSTLALKTINKCCPDYQHYIEDNSLRLMCANVTTVINAISMGNEGFQFLQRYPCETSFGMYVNNFEKLDVNGLGYVTYKKKIYPRSCIDYDTKRERWIIMECTSSKLVLDERRLKQKIEKLDILDDDQEVIDNDEEEEENQNENPETTTENILASIEDDDVSIEQI